MIICGRRKTILTRLDKKKFFGRRYVYIIVATHYCIITGNCPKGCFPALPFVRSFVIHNRLFQNLLVHYTNIVILLSVRCSICKLLVPFERSGVDPSSCNSVGHRLLTNYVCVCNISLFQMLTVRHILFTKKTELELLYFSYECPV